MSTRLHVLSSAVVSRPHDPHPRSPDVHPDQRRWRNDTLESWEDLPDRPYNQIVSTIRTRGHGGSRRHSQFTLLRTLFSESLPSHKVFTFKNTKSEQQKPFGESKISSVHKRGGGYQSSFHKRKGKSRSLETRLCFVTSVVRRRVSRNTGSEPSSYEGRSGAVEQDSPSISGDRLKVIRPEVCSSPLFTFPRPVADFTLSHRQRLHIPLPSFGLWRGFPSPS